MGTAKTLIRLGANSLCWFCHVVAHIKSLTQIHEKNKIKKTTKTRTIKLVSMAF